MLENLSFAGPEIATSAKECQVLNELMHETTNSQAASERSWTQDDKGLFHDSYTA